MRRTLLGLALCAALSLTSCEQEKKDTDTLGTGSVLVLNNGNWGGNDASISVYDPLTGKVSGDAFLKANGRNLGDLGQDIMALGEDIYISVNGSRTIFVTGKDLRIKKVIEVSEDGSKLSPRCLASGGGKAYVTFYEGFLGEIDPETYEVRLTPVGPNPDGLAYAGGKIYVANSGGYLPDFNDTVSVVDAESFKEVETIKVVCNPSMAVAGKDGIYVLSYGNYNDIAPALQRIDGKVEKLDAEGVQAISVNAEGELIYGPDGYQVEPGFYSISVIDGDIYVGASDYRTSGDVYVFDKDGKLKNKFDSMGLNPIKCIKR